MKTLLDNITEANKNGFAATLTINGELKNATKEYYNRGFWGL